MTTNMHVRQRHKRIRTVVSPSGVFLVLGIVAIGIAPLFVDYHYKDLLVQGFIFAVFAISLDLLWGYAGALSLGQSAFFGLGAYALGIAASQIGVGFIGITVGIVGGILVATILAALIGWVAFYSRGVTPIYISVITLAAALILQRLGALTDLEWLSRYTGGYNGLSFFANAWTVDRWYVVTATALIVTTALALVVARSDFGRLLIGIRDNERRMAYLGYNVPLVKLSVFIASAAVAALAGMAYGAYIQRADPVLLGLAVAVDVLIVVAIGGRGTIIGPVLAAVIVGGQSNPFGLIGPTISEHWVDYWQLMLGLLFVGCVLLLPHGFYPAGRSLVVTAWRRVTGGQERAIALSSHLVLSPSRARWDGDGPLVSVNGVEKSYGSLHVLRGVTLDVSAEEILCIVGPNGAGKSTLIEIITDTRAMSGGVVRILGVSRRKMGPAQISRLGVGRTFQGSNLMETLTVADSLFIAHNCGSVPSLWRRTTEIPVQSSVLILDRATGLSEFLDTRVADLSHGKRQALELSMALALDPVLLLLDEPTAGLSEEERSTVGTLLQELRVRGLGIVLIEHDLDFVKTITDKVAVLHHGAVAIQGPVDEVVGSALVREIYLGVKA